MKRMAVDLLAVLPGGTNGGAKILALDLLDGLSEDWDITCFCQASAEAEISRMAGGRFRTIAVTKPAEFSAVYDAQVAAGGPFDVNFFPMQRVSLIRTGTPAVSVIHDVQFADLPENFTPAERAERAEAFRSCMEFSDLVITVSHFSKTRIEAVAGIDGARIKVIHNGLKSRRVSSAVPRSIAASSKGFFLYPANFWPHKNHRCLLEAYRAYREIAAAPHDLVLTGDPDVGQAGSSMVLEAQPGVRFIGFVERTELLDLMERATALVFPSVYEGFGMPLVEAMAAGTPIACSNRGSLPEVVGSAALLFDPEEPRGLADAMAQLGSDEALRAALVDKGRARLTEIGGFSRMRRSYHDAFLSILDRQEADPLRVEGVGSDGWAGPDVTIGFSGGQEPQRLQLQVTLPAWVPLAYQTLAITSGTREIARKTLWPGQRRTIDLPLGRGEHDLSIKAFASFRLGDVIDSKSALPVSYRLEEASCFVEGRRFRIRPSDAGQDPQASVALLAIMGMPEQAVMLTSVGVCAQPVALRILPDISDDGVRFRCIHDALSSNLASTPATRVELPPVASPPHIEFPDHVHVITFRAHALAAPAIINDAHMERGFSVIVPSFNQGRFIKRTIDSILCQDHLCEVLVLDGGSTDETLDILASYGPHISWWSQKDEGQADAVNQGIARARGEYIAWINSDDTYAPDAFVHVDRMFSERPDVGVVYGNAHHIDAEDRVIEAYPTADFDAASLFDRCFICQPAAFFRRRVAVEHGGLRQSLRYCLDYEFWLRLSSVGVRFARSEELLSHSRMYAENKTLGERLHAYFETADMLIRGFGYFEGQWIEHFANAVADYLQGRHGIPRAFALREARRLGNTIWTAQSGREAERWRA